MGGGGSSWTTFSRFNWNVNWKRKTKMNLLSLSLVYRRGQWFHVTAIGWIESPEWIETRERNRTTSFPCNSRPDSFAYLAGLESRGKLSARLCSNENISLEKWKWLFPLISKITFEQHEAEMGTALISVKLIASASLFGHRRHRWSPYVIVVVHVLVLNLVDVTVLVTVTVLW